MSRKKRPHPAAAGTAPARREDAPLPPPGRPAPWRDRALPAAALFLLTLVVFSPVLRGEFLNWDDMPFIAGNPAYNPPTGGSLLRYWTELRPTEQFYVPVMQSIWWAIAAVTGHERADGTWHLAPGPFHAASWLAHAAASALAYLLIRRFAQDRAAAWIGAAVFAVHPIQAEAVSWASTFYTPLSTAFALAALWQLARYLELRYDGREAITQDVAARRRRRPYVALALGTCFLAAGLLSKPAVVLAPVIGGMLEVCLRRRPWRQVVFPVVGWTLLCVPAMVVARVAQPPFRAYWPVWQRPFMAADSLTFYLSKILVPVGLATDYGRSPQWLADNGAWRYTWIAPVLALAGLTFVSVRRRSWWPVVCGAAFVAAALPTLGLSPFHYQEYSTVADRYVYFAMFAVGLAAAGLMTLARTPAHRTRAYAVAGCGLLVLAAMAHRQTRLWHDSETLFTHVLNVNPDSLAGHFTMGEVAKQKGDQQAAIDHLLRAMDGHPGDVHVLSRVGDLALELGLYKEAVALYEQAAAPMNPPPPGLLKNWGIALTQCGRLPEAADVLERAVDGNPHRRESRLSLAVVRARLGQWDAARAQFEAVLRIDPKSAAAREGLAQLKAAGH